MTSSTSTRCVAFFYMVICSQFNSCDGFDDEQLLWYSICVDEYFADSSLLGKDDQYFEDGDGFEEMAIMHLLGF